MVERDISSHLSKSKLERCEAPFEMGRFACVLFLLLFTLIVSFIFNQELTLLLKKIIVQLAAEAAGSKNGTGKKKDYNIAKGKKRI